jgi:hypothetical protein
VTLAGVPPRRLGLVTARDAHLSLADRAVRDSVLRIVARYRPGIERPVIEKRVTERRGRDAPRERPGGELPSDHA